MTDPNIVWRKATASDSDGSCVEVARLGDGALVRDTKDAEAGPVLRFNEDEWQAFLDGARKGEFD